MRPALARLGIAIAVSGIFTGSALALPGTVLPEHPRLYATAADLKKLIDAVPAALQKPEAVSFPGKRGRLSFSFTPSGVTDPKGDVDRAIFGNSKADGIYLRYLDSQNGVGRVQIGVKSNGFHSAEVVNVQYNVRININVEWNAEAQNPVMQISIADNVFPVRTLESTFDIKSQNFEFAGRPGDKLTDLELAVGDKLLHKISTAQTANILETYGAWHGLLLSARKRGRRL